MPRNRLTTFEGFVARRPRAARLVLTATTIAAIAVPAEFGLAYVWHLPWFVLLAAVASISVYDTGYLAAVWHQRHLRADLAEARRDAVTGLPVRAVAEAALHEATANATRLTVALADVDGLRAVNNGRGHPAGDQYLRAVAQRLQRAVPAGGLLARTGGDEFVILAPGTDPADLCAAVGAAFAGPALVAGRRMQPRASVGIAESDGSNAHRALARADAAMYSAKQAGGNHILIFDPARDGEPEADGSRPLVRRRDRRPTGADTVEWQQPRRGEELLAVLWSATDAARIRNALVLARDQFADAAAKARAGGHTAQRHRPTTGPDRIDVEPTPAGCHSTAAVLGAHQAIYAHLVERISDLIDAAQPGAQ